MVDSMMTTQSHAFAGLAYGMSPSGLRTPPAPQPRTLHMLHQFIPPPITNSPSWVQGPGLVPSQSSDRLLFMTNLVGSMTPSAPPPPFPPMHGPSLGLARSLTWMPPDIATVQQQLQRGPSFVPPVEQPRASIMQSLSWAPPLAEAAGYVDSQPSLSWAPPCSDAANGSTARQQTLSWVPPAAPVSFPELHFVSAAATKQHPAKISTGIVNADIVMETTMHLGICDGVSGVHHLGIPPDELPRDLLHHCREKLMYSGGRHSNKEDGAWLVGLIEDAFDATQAYGATTLLLATLRDTNLVTASLGDCALLVLRPSSLRPFRLRPIFKTVPGRYDSRRPVQVQRLHGFSDANAHTVIQGAMVSTTPVQHGDLLILGSDGLFDNLRDEDVQRTVEDCCASALNAAACAGSQPLMPSCAQLRHVAAALVDLAIASVRLNRGEDAGCSAPWGGHGGDVPANNADDTTALVAAVVQSASPTAMRDDEPLESCAGVIDAAMLGSPVLRGRASAAGARERRSPKASGGWPMSQSTGHLRAGGARGTGGSPPPSSLRGQRRVGGQCELRHEDCAIA